LPFVRVTGNSRARHPLPRVTAAGSAVTRDPASLGPARPARSGRQCIRVALTPTDSNVKVPPAFPAPSRPFSSRAGLQDNVWKELLIMQVRCAQGAGLVSALRFTRFDALDSIARKGKGRVLVAARVVSAFFLAGPHLRGQPSAAQRIPGATISCVAHNNHNPAPCW
jgi:hypothetical protein